MGRRHRGKQATERRGRRWWQRRAIYVSVLAVIAAFVVAASVYHLFAPPDDADHRGTNRRVTRVDVMSAYSHIRICDDGDVRSLLFVRDNGDEYIESNFRLSRPYELLSEYTRAMFASYVLCSRQQRVLIVGLGGGAMVHFLTHYDPDVQVDVVEIDPVVVDLANRYFDVRTSGNVRVITADAFDYFDATENRYDVIYMDAFLKPAADTDATGVPLRLKTLSFYKQLQTTLRPGGLVVFNLNTHTKLMSDVETIREAFPHTYVLTLSDGALVVFGATDAAPVGAATLAARAEAADRRFKTTFSFAGLLQQISGN